MMIEMQKLIKYSIVFAGLAFSQCCPAQDCVPLTLNTLQYQLKEKPIGTAKWTELCKTDKQGTNAKDMVIAWNKLEKTKLSCIYDVFDKTKNGKINFDHFFIWIGFPDKANVIGIPLLHCALVQFALDGVTIDNCGSDATHLLLTEKINYKAFFGRTIQIYEIK